MQGELIAKASPKLELEIKPSIFKKLEEKEKQEILYWGYFDEDKRRYCVDFDNTKFINHSKDGNITQEHGHHSMYLIAKRDIKVGEELTQNYLEFESKEDFEKRGIKY